MTPNAASATGLGQEGLVEAALGRAGYGFVACGTVARGRLALRERTHALAIIDADLPDGAGLDLLTSAAGTPAVLLASHREVAERLVFLRAEAADCVAKPYDAQHLVARALSVLARRKGAPAVLASGYARRVLLVDDSASYARALGDELQRDGHDVAIARTAAEGLVYMAVQDSNLVLISPRLPDMSGADLYTLMRGSPALRRTPVLLLPIREKTVILGRPISPQAAPNPGSAVPGPGEPDSADMIRPRDLESVRMQARRVIAEERPAPSSQQSVPPPSRRDVGPPSQRGSPPSQSVPPPSRRDVGPPSQRGGPTSQPSAPPPRREAASQPSAPPPSVHDGPPSSRRFPPPSSRRDLLPSVRGRTLAETLRPPRTPTQVGVPLLDQIAALSGLSQIAGRPALERACQRAGVNALRTAADLERCLPEIELALRAFLAPEVVEARMVEIARLART